MCSNHDRRAMGAMLLGLACAFSAQAANLSINQFRVRGPAGGNDEFVELYNRGSQPLDLSGYKFNASNSAGTTGTRLTLPSGSTIRPGCYLLLSNSAASGYSGGVAGDLKYSSGVTDDGGLALLDASGTLIDQVGLSSGSAYKAGTPLAALGSTNADKGYVRASDGAGQPKDSGDNRTDFVPLSPTTPHNSASQCVAQAPSANVADASVTVAGAGDLSMLFRVKLSEPAGVAGFQLRVVTADDTATVAAGDYEALSQLISVPAGADHTDFAVTVHGKISGSADKAFTLKLSEPSTGFVLSRDSAIGAILYDIPVALEIWQIQGREQISAYVGKSVTTHGNIVTAVGPASFTMQTPDARADADPLTSNGVYVFTSAKPTVAIGDVVDVTARVDNYYNLTELTNASVSITSHDAALPAAVRFDDQRPSGDPNKLSCGATNFQCYVGMRVVIEDGMINTGNKRFSNQPYAEVSITANGKRSLRLPGVRYSVAVPAGVNLPNWSGNPQVFKMNTADFGAMPANTSFNAGSRFRAEGVISYDFGAYTFIPTRFELIDAVSLPRAVSERPSGSLRVGAFNVERFCDTQFNTVYTCSGDSAEPSADEVTLKTRRLSAYIGGVLRLPDVLSVEEVKSLGVLQGLAKQLGDDYPARYEAYLIPGHDPSGINVGFLVRSDRVQVVSVRQLGADETWLDNGSTRYLHDHPPLLLTAEYGNLRFHMISLHPKARQNVDKSGRDADRDRQKRFLQAKSIATQVQQWQTSAPSDPLLVVGDFNAYQFSDGWADVVGLISGKYRDDQNLLKLGDNIVTPALWNAVESVPENDRYSFLFIENFGPIQGYTKAGSGNTGRSVPTVQVLDHALLNRAAVARFERMQYGRANLDAPVQTQDDAVHASDISKAIGASDHDGFVIDLMAPLPSQRPHKPTPAAAALRR